MFSIVSSASGCFNNWRMICPVALAAASTAGFTMWLAQTLGEGMASGSGSVLARAVGGGDHVGARRAAAAGQTLGVWGSAIVSAIVAMGHSLDLRVVAEGVETAEQSAYLRSTGCDEAQGYLFGRPVPSDELNVLLLYTPTLSPS